MSEELGKYRLLRHLATGGMAEIWLAEQEGPEGFAKELVIKRILPHLVKDQQFTEMFLDEARLAAQLTHPNIGQIFELGQIEDDYYIAMEFIDGLSLEQVIEKAIEDGASIDCDLAARIVADTLQALDFAHDFEDREGNPLNIVHRDVTPSNVLVSKDGIVKLVDFGVAKAAAKKSKTQTGAVKGKYAYMSPEQIETESIDRRSDIFATGIVFYELLTLTKPFGDELAAVSGILSRDPDDPRNVRPDIPEQFVQIIGKALQKDRTKRYDSAQTMLLDIETALRMRNAYVGPREVSRLIRQQLGLKVAPASTSGEHSGLFEADRSADISFTAANSAVASGDADLPFKPTAALESVDAEESSETTSAERLRSVADRINVVYLLGGLLAAIAIATVVVVVVAVTRDVDRSDDVWEAAKGKTYTVTTAPRYADGADPELWRHSDGRLVVVETIPSSKIYRRGKFVARTPFQTTLKPDRYAVEFRRDDLEKPLTIEVGDSPKYQRFRVVLADHDDRTVEPESSREKDESKSAPASVINKVKSIFR